MTRLSRPDEHNSISLRGEKDRHVPGALWSMNFFSILRSLVSHKQTAPLSLTEASSDLEKCEKPKHRTACV